MRQAAEHKAARWVLRHAEALGPRYAIDGRLDNGAPAGSFPARANQIVRKLIASGWLAPADLTNLRLQLADARHPASPRQRWADRVRQRARRIELTSIGSHAEYSPRQRTIYLNELALDIDAIWRFPAGHYKTVVFVHELGHSLVAQASVRLFDRLPALAAFDSRAAPTDPGPWQALTAIEAAGARGWAAFHALAPEDRFKLLFSEHQHRLLAEEMYADALSIGALACLTDRPTALAVGASLLQEREAEARRPRRSDQVGRLRTPHDPEHATAPALRRVLTALVGDAWARRSDPLELQGVLLDCVAGGLGDVLTTSARTGAQQRR